MRRSVGRTGAPASIPKQPGRAARFTDVGAAGQIGSRTDPPHCTSRHRVDVDRARDWPYLSEPESLLPDRRPPEPLFASARSEEHTSELQSLAYLVCRLLLEKKKKKTLITLMTNDKLTL